MIIFVLLLGILSFYKCKPLLSGEFYKDYSSIDQTRAINGICIMLILLSHTFAKVSSSDIFDEIYIPMRTFLGQFVVVPILFYSGYGIMESLSKKGSYLKNFPTKRFLNLAVRFAIITIVYIIMHLCLGSKYSPLYMLLSFTGITSIGNGGWYMLSTFVFYISVILCFNIFKKNKVIAVIAVNLCLVTLMVAEIMMGFPTYYYSTTIFLGVGMVYSLLKGQFDKIVMKNNFIWCMVFLIGIAGFIFAKKYMDVSPLFYPIWSGFGMLMILCFTMKVKIQNAALIWLGQTIFFNFTLQGIPQIIFTKILSNNYLIYILTIITALFLTYFADFLFTKGEKALRKVK